MNAMRITLHFCNRTLHALAEIESDKPLQELSFLLNSRLHMEQILCDGLPMDAQVQGDCHPQFRTVCNQYSLRTAQPFHSLTLRYAGDPGSWWHCAITESFIALNFYAVWFPQELPFPVDQDEVRIEGCADYLLLKGSFDPTDEVWRYGGEGFDPFNLILYRKSDVHIAHGEHITIYYLDEHCRDAAEQSMRVFEDILTFYTTELYHQPYHGHIDMACDAPPVSQDGGAYKRKELIVTNTPGSSEDDLIGINAHELAHEWCAGASWDWNDWLNETSAEWSMLLYALSRGKTGLYQRMMARHQKIAAQVPGAIRTADGRRPAEGVHSKGTVLLDNVYHQLGEEAVRAFLICFVNLEEKTTDQLLHRLRDTGWGALAERLEAGINAC